MGIIKPVKNLAPGEGAIVDLDEENLSLEQELSKAIVDGERWDMGSLRAKLMDILERHSKRAPAAASQWKAYRRKPLNVYAARHPLATDFIIVDSDGRITTADSVQFIREFEEIP